jgi:hypothetical protein
VKADAEALLVQEYGYVPYGQKHFEDLLTKFLEGYWLPTRFGYDIRKAQLSSLILTKQMSREEALNKLNNPPCTEKECKEMFNEVAAKLQISEEELMRYHNMPKCTRTYKNSKWLYRIGEKIFLLLGKELVVNKL